MIHNGTPVKDKNGIITGYIYGETADEPMNKPESVEDEPKKAVKKTTATKKK